MVFNEIFVANEIYCSVNKNINKKRLDIISGIFLMFWMRVPKRSLVFYSKIRNFTVVPNRQFVFLQQNTQFYSCTQTTICFLQQNVKFRIVPERPFVFFPTKHNILKTAPKQPFIISQRNWEFWKLYPKGYCIFHKQIRDLTIYHQFSFVS